MIHCVFSVTLVLCRLCTQSFLSFYLDQCNLVSLEVKSCYCKLKPRYMSDVKTEVTPQKEGDFSGTSELISQIAPDIIIVKRES